jgi:hypothetical protein
MALVQRAITFVVAWILLYIIVYFAFMAPKFLISRKHEKYTRLAPKEIILRKQANIASSIEDPFLASSLCLDVFPNKRSKAAVVIVVHDEEFPIIMHTVSIIALDMLILT